MCLFRFPTLYLATNENIHYIVYMPGKHYFMMEY